MATDSTQFLELAECLRSYFEIGRKIEQMIEALVGDIQGTPPARFDKFLDRCGVTEEQFAHMSTDEMIDGLKYPTRIGNLIAALDMIFEARYGWPKGTGAQLGLGDVFLALEHALGYDDPCKPSVWQLTR